MKQPPIKTKELYGSTVQIADGQNWEIASITAYGENAQGGTTEAPVALTGVDSVFVGGNNLFSAKLVADKVVDVKRFTSYDKSNYYSTDTPIPVMKNTTYRLSSSGVLFRGNLHFKNKKGKTLSQIFNFYTFTVPNDADYIMFTVLEERVTDPNAPIMLNVGTEPLPYEPYQGSVTQLPIQRPLRRVGDVRDVCVTRQEYEGTEKLVVTYNVGFVELDGTEYMTLGNIDASQKVQQFNISNVLSSPKGTDAICSHISSASSVNEESISIYDNRLLVAVWLRDPLLEYGFVAGDSGTYIHAFKAYLAAQKAAGTPVQIAYQLATPETYATDPLDFDNAAGPLTVMTGGELEVTLTHRMLTPYTAWTIQYDSEEEYTGDFFNVEDYDRIKQNIEYLREYAYFLYGGFTLRGMAAVTVESYGYASTIDALDANLEAIAANTFRPPDMLPVKQWRGNQPPPGADDWNRIENTCLLLFEQFERQAACRPKLAFELKGSAF